MALPQPEIGLVVHYSYLFLTRTKSFGGACKERPCLIAAVFEDKEDPLKTGVLYLPITHSEPGPTEKALEIPANARAAAGLDGFRQWILISQGNVDTWPEDIFNLPNQPGVFQYGLMPPMFYKVIQQEFGKLFARKLFHMVPRNAPGP